MRALRLVALLSTVAVTLIGCRQAAEEAVQAPKQAEEQPAPPQEVAITFDGKAFSMNPTTIEAAPVTLLPKRWWGTGFGFHHEVSSR